MQPPGHHLAEFNIGILRHDWDDPRIADFVNGLAQVNAIAERSPGFVWRLGDDDMDSAQNDPCGVLGGNPRTASTLSVWRDGASLRHFVRHTVHRRYFDRRREWFDMGDALRMVLWWVPVGHRPTLAEAKARFDLLEASGPGRNAFGWAWISPAG